MDRLNACICVRDFAEWNWELDQKRSKKTMKLVLIGVLAAAPCAYAQDTANAIFQSQAAGPVTMAAGGALMKVPGNPVQGAPYSATITNESVQTLADGNRIVQTTTGAIARDSLGRTFHDATLPAIGNLSAADAPHLIFIQDPVAHVSYTLNLTDKTAQKIPMPPAMAGSMATEGGSGAFFMQMDTVAVASTAGAMSGGASGAGMTSGSVTSDAVTGAALPLPPTTTVQKVLLPADPSQVSTEDLGSQTMEGIVVIGVRTTRTIPAGEMGNEKPIVIVTEVWTSPDLKTIISSKRSDPRMGDQTFHLTNLVRAEPDASLFTVPSDFKIVDGPQHVIYRSNR
jgi:hypothetical protein